MRGYWWLLIIPILPLLVSGVGLTKRPPSRSVASLRFQLWPETDIDFGQNPRDIEFYWQSAEYTTLTMADWVRGSLFRQRVAEKANIALSELDPTITASGDKTGLSIWLWSDAPGALPKLAQATVEVVQSESANFLPQLAGMPVRTLLVDGPRFGTEQQRPWRNWSSWLLRFTVAFFLGLSFMMMAHRWRPLVWDVEDAPVALLGRIPPNQRRLQLRR